MATRSRGTSGTVPLVTAVLASMWVWAPAAWAQLDVEALIRSGDAAWAARAEGHDGRGLAAEEPIARAIRAYEAAVALDPDRLGAHWRYVRALFFEGEYAHSEPDARQASFDRAAAASNAAFEALARRSSDAKALRRNDPERTRAAFAAKLHPDVARIHFWSALAWGARGRYYGILDGVRNGVARRLYRYAEVTIALEPTLAHGGPHRLMASLQQRVPRIPFLTGWVDKDRILPELERAMAIAPDFPGNQLLYAHTLLDLAPERREEARALLNQVAALEPDPSEVVEQLEMRESARETLAEQFNQPTLHAP
ncbi:MAG: hypothetical protein JRG85_18390 [Deltaproteobacteria bacterium]|nr:hypothetical protein [Deltaproteobacteria bacterium]